MIDHPTVTSHSVGFVYVLTNVFMPGLVKVGQTSSLVEDRAKDLYTTGVPAEFKIAYIAMTSWPQVVEQSAHKALSAHRVNARREFFHVEVEKAIEAVCLSSVEMAGIAKWKSQGPHTLRSGDRIALSLEAGQIFALISYSNLESLPEVSPEIVDVWQAHSTGDLLEIFASDSATHVAGFSDSDPGSTVDPLPYLNRAGTFANGVLNGRERLMPGDRLVWIPEPEKAELQKSVIFEAKAYCQISSRTWRLSYGPEGYPLLLNSFDYDEPWPAAICSMQEGLRLPIPRVWAPRENRDSDWENLGSALPNPEYWLPQPKPRVRKVKSRSRIK